MTNVYTIGLSHHSISRSREVSYVGSLTGAKRKATAEFGDGFADHNVVIWDAAGHVVSSRKISDRNWTNSQ